MTVDAEVLPVRSETLSSVFALNGLSELPVTFREVAGTPVLIIDNLYKDPFAVRQFALSLDYFRQVGLYPGEFAFVSVSQAPLLELVRRRFVPKLGRNIVGNSWYQEATFAVTSKQPEELVPEQRQPHYDTFCDVAGVVYLNTPDQCSGGTSFWRHRSSGLESAPLASDPVANAMALLKGHGDAEGLLRYCMREGLNDTPAGYPTASTAVWEMTQMIGMRFNRLLLYNARLFHSPHIEPGEIKTENKSRRLTQNVYFNWADKADGGRKP